jgi:MerR family glutamine synthetase transcriptional repressor
MEYNIIKSMKGDTIMDDNVRRNLPLFPISIVKQLTELSARQIRYYEDHRLIKPARTDGNRRVFSFNDVDKLLEIKSMLDKGINLAGIREVFEVKANGQQPEIRVQLNPKEVTDEDLYKRLKNELYLAGRNGRTSLIQGELSRFFH